MGDFTDLLGQPDEALPEPLATPATQAPQRKSQFQTLIDGPSEQDAALGINLNGAASTTPDAHAKAMDIGGTIGAPADAVAANMQESERLARLQRYREALGDAPKMQKLLAEDPDLAKISADDLKVLGDTESTFGRIMSAFYGVTPEHGGKLADVGASVPQGALQAVGGGLAGLGEINDVLGRTLERGMRAVGLDTAADVLTNPVLPWWLNPSGILKQPGTALKDMGDAVGPAEDRQNIATDIGSGVGQVIGQISTALVAGPAASLAMLFGQGADQLAERVEKAGKAGTAEGDAAIIAGAGITAITEKYGLEALLNRVPPAVKNRILRQIADIAVGGGIEAAQEVVEGILQNLAEKLLINPNADLTSGWQQDATAAGGTGAVIRALVNAATKGRQISSNVHRQQRAGQDAATVEALVKGTADSKLRERNPDAFAAVMAAQTQGTPVETFFIPAERIAELYQTGGPVVDGVDPLDQIEGLRDQLQEALAVGGDVEISAADYLTHIAPTPLHGALKNDLRASRDGWSVNDAKAYAEDPAREAEVAALVERQADAATAAAPGQAVFDQAYADLMDTGRYTSGQAAEEATLTRERFVGRAARFGNPDVTPEMLYDESRLQILGPTEAGDVAPAEALAQATSPTAFGDFSVQGRDLLRDGAKVGAIKLRAEGGATPHLVVDDIEVVGGAGKGQGTGTAALQALIEEAHGQGMAVALTTDAMRGKEHQKRLRGYYERLGFVKNRGADKVAGVDAEYVLPAPAGSTPLFQRAAKPLGTDPKEVAHTVIDILYGDTPAIKANTREVGDIARDLMARGQRALRALGVKGGVIEGPDPKTDEIISRAIAAELKAALEKSSRNASDWYTRKVEQAMAIAALMHPEIATDPIAQMGFTAALAITSQGETVPSNVRLADPIYRIFRETGRFPTTVRAKNGPAMTANFEKLNDLLDDLGPEGTHEFLHAKFTVGDLKKRGYPIGGENVGTEVYGSAILGPKIGGGFYQNLNRNYSPVTMDLWFMRAWGRLAGTLVGNTNPESLQKQKDRLTAALEAAGRKVPKTDATLEKIAEEIRTAHERDFRDNRKLYDSGEKTKAELTYAAERYLIGLNGINEQPGSGSERVWMRGRVERARGLLAAEGITLTNADAQAIWWYPEKDLYAKLGGRDSEAINVDYAGALANLAREKGVSDDTITRAVGALDQRSRSAGTTDDAGAEQGGSQSDQGTDGRAGGAGGSLFQSAASEDVGAGERGATQRYLAQSPEPYTRRSPGTDRPLRVGDAQAVALWEGDGPTLLELESGDVSARTFSAAIQAAKAGNRFGAAVYVYPDEDYAGMRLFLTEDGLAGVALKGDDIVSAFKAPGSPRANAAKAMLSLAVQLGGRRLDAFDTVLPDLYAKAGFSVAARLPWDESQAPDGWDKAVFAKYNGGTPDVVFMAYTGRTDAYQAGEGPYAADYDDALRLQAEAVKAGPLEQGVQGSYQQKRDPYGNLTNIIRLTKDSNLSTFLHESGHFYLFQLIDDSFDPRATPEARVKLQADLQTVLDHLGIKIDVATASADQIHAAMTREAHELWARSFEVYAREGKAPSAALRDAFASFASWLVRIYKSLKTIPDYTKRLTPEVRGVMDRLLATDEAIADAQASASFRVPAALRTVMTTAEQRSLERLTEEATHEARAELQKRVMAELARERREWWREERARVRGEVETEVRNRPSYRAYNLLRHGETPDGDAVLDSDGNPTKPKLDKAGLTQAYGKDVLKQLPKGVAAQNGVNHEVFAGLVGFGSGDELRDALVNLQPMKATIDAETDARMKAKHGDMLTDGRLQADAAEIVLNQKQVELAALQAKVLERLAAGVKAKADKKAASGKREAVKQVRRLQTGLDAKAIAAAAKRAIAGKRLEDAVPAKYRAQADRLGREVEVAIAKQDYELAARLKEQQVVNLALAKEAQDVQAAVGKALKRFGRLRKPDSKLAGATDIEFVGAARAILSRFGLSSPQTGFDQQVWFQRLAEDDPAGAVDMQQMIEAATAGAGTVAARGRTRTRAKSGGAPTAMGDVWRQMTVDEFLSLTDTVDALLHMGRDARSVQIEGERVAIKAAVGEMLAQASGRDSGKRIGQTEAVTDAEKRTRSFWGVAAFLERVESWARRMDDGKVGPFTKYLLRPVLAAVYEYRAEKTRRIKQLVDILEPRKAELLGKPIHSDELNYTFQNKGALLHALLHSGNDSNFRKLLLGGRGKGFAWGEIDKKTGALDTSKWDRMINRMVRDGTLTKADYDTAQAIWDLLEELKGPAQIAHRKMKGFYFQEVETSGIQTPFGKYRGGYVPAVTDRLLNPDAGARVDANAMGEMANAGILPSVAKGFTKSRVEYNQPLELNVSKLTGHMDTVLKFTHLGPVIRDVTRLVINREFRSEMFGIDAHAIDEVLVPWLQRVARQTTEIPFTSEGARTFGKFFKALQRNTGIAAMAGNILNAAQQITGLSVAMAEVRPTRVLRGLVSSVAAPRQSAQMIMGKSAFMKDRMDNSTHELMTTLDDLLTDKGRFRKLRDKTDKHGYFAQVFTQNLVDRAVWLGSYEQNIAKGMTEAEAVLGADGVVRQTQGSFAPEDVSRVEVQNAFARPFVQFYSYFNAQFNFLRAKFDSTVQELGWVGGSPRLFYIYLMGAMVPAVLADAMMQAATGQLGDDDDDGLIDDIGELFAMSQLRYFAAMVPAVGTAVNFGIHLFNDKPYDDRLSVAPVVSQAERIGGTVVKLATGKESTTGRAVQDALLIISMFTGLPLAQLGKPLGYFTDVVTGEQEGETVGDWIRGTLTGREAPKQ